MGAKVQKKEEEARRGLCQTAYNLYNAEQLDEEKNPSSRRPKGLRCEGSEGQQRHYRHQERTYPVLEEIVLSQQTSRELIQEDVAPELERERADVEKKVHPREEQRQRGEDTYIASLRYVPISTQEPQDGQPHREAS